MADSLEDGTPSAPLTEPQPLGACAAIVEEAPLAEATGSAGIMYNLAEHPKSIRAVAAKLLASALDSSAAHKPVACATGCTPAKNPKVIYRVSPVKFLAPAQQQALCKTLERDTEQHPLRFPTQEFATVEDLNSWVMEFSQGRGEHGKRLYEQCGGNCSPRYTFVIASGTSGLNVDTEVICGLARDRDADDYQISTAVRNQCAVDDAPLASHGAE